jgi:hypothetical protein
LSWDDEVEDVLAGDLTAALGYRAPPNKTLLLLLNGLLAKRGVRRSR